MKKNIICIVLIILAATGCEKFLNQAPTGEQTKEYISKTTFVHNEIWIVCTSTFRGCGQKTDRP